MTVPTPFDIITVPDFRAGKRNRFTARTLFFLASWHEFGGAARDFPLHLACIGEPPSVVTALAERVGAHIRVFDPLPIDDRSMCNKLRGLEVEIKTDRILLIDNDALFLADPSPLARLHPVPFISAAPAGWAPDLSPEVWTRLYDSVGLDAPSPTLRPAAAQAGLTAGNSILERRLRRMPPYFNGGVLFFPAAIGWHRVWLDHLRRLKDAWEKAAPSGQTPFNDQLGIATTIQQFHQERMPFVPLPSVYNTRWFELYRRKVKLSAISIFHAIGMFSEEPEINNLRTGIRLYQNVLLQRFDRALNAQTPVARISGYFRHMQPARRDVSRLGKIWNQLYDQYIADLIHLE